MQDDAGRRTIKRIRFESAPLFFFFFPILSFLLSLDSKYQAEPVDTDGIGAIPTRR